MKRGGKFGYIDRKGAIVIDFIFDEALPSSEDFLCVCRKGLWGYIQNPLKHQKYGPSMANIPCSRSAASVQNAPWG